MPAQNRPPDPPPSSSRFTRLWLRLLAGLLVPRIPLASGGLAGLLVPRIPLVPSATAVRAPLKGGAWGSVGRASNIINTYAHSPASHSFYTARNPLIATL
jgi:hypothetical protein